MIINATSGNRIALERELREISKVAGTDCHVFSVFDMCKSIPELYPGLTYTQFQDGDRGEDQDAKEIEGRRVQDIGLPFHAISAAELQSTTRADSDLSVRIINHIESKHKKGFIKIPNTWLGFNGVITSAKDAQPYKVKLVGLQFGRREDGKEHKVGSKKGQDPKYLEYNEEEANARVLYNFGQIPNKSDNGKGSNPNNENVAKKNKKSRWMYFMTALIAILVTLAIGIIVWSTRGLSS